MARQPEATEIRSDAMKLRHELNKYEFLTDVLHKNIKAAKSYPSILTEPEHKGLCGLLDKALLNYLSSLDLATELKFLDASMAIGNQFEANFFARITALSCFEVLDNRNVKLGKETRSLALSIAGCSAREDLDKCLRELNKIAADESPKLKTIRNNLFGHRIKIGKVQADEMLHVNPKAIFDLGWRILHIEFAIAEAYMVLAKNI